MRDLDSLTVRHLREFQNYLITTGNCRRTINQKIGRIKTVFRWATSLEMVDTKVYHSFVSLPALRRGRTNAPDLPPVPPVLFREVRRATHKMSPTIRRMVLIQWVTGMRSGELVRMSWECFTMIRGAFVYTPKEHKTEHFGHTRQIVFGPRSLAILGRRLDIGPVFSNGNGKQYTPTSYRREVIRACDRAGIDHWTPLQLRHSAAKRFRKLMGIESARLALGHASAFTTEIYNEYDLDDLVKIAQRAS